MQLLKSQKNDIFDVIQNSDLSPAQFELSEYDENYSYDETITNTKLAYKNTDFYFLFETGDRNEHISTFSPGRETVTQRENPGNWITQLLYVKEWLSNLEREITQEDKWVRLEEEIENLKISDNDNNQKFSVEEYEVLTKKLNVLKEKISEIELLPEQIETISRKIDFLTETAKSFNKTDWKSLFMGTFIQLVFQLSIPPETSGIIWKTIKGIFTNYFLQ
ncbi:MAG: hypothetical protein Q7K21_00615 [Elusimicrobiota bacterium]|nr:hypothetical protein [Elusimicrobiota bacterium]